MRKIAWIELSVYMAIILVLLLPHHAWPLPAQHLASTWRFRPPHLHPTLSLGYDQLGRALAPRLIIALSTSLNISVVALLTSYLLSCSLALLSTLLPKTIAKLPLKLAYITFIIPAILLAAMLSQVSASRSFTIYIVLSLSSLFVLSQQARHILLSQQNQAYWLYALSSGANPYQRIKRHQISYLLRALTPLALTRLSSLMILESTLSFLGLGLQPPTLSLGQLLQESIAYLHSATYLFFIPALSFISLTFLLQWIGLRSLSILNQKHISPTSRSTWL